MRRPRPTSTALGLTLYELLALRPAFDVARPAPADRPDHPDGAVRLRELDRGVPRDLETIVLKAIEKDPGGRYATAGRLAEDLRRLLEDTSRSRRSVPSGPLERLAQVGHGGNPSLAAPSSLGQRSGSDGTIVAVLIGGYAQVAAQPPARAVRRRYFQRIALAERAWSGNSTSAAPRSCSTTAGPSFAAGSGTTSNGSATPNCWTLRGSPGAPAQPAGLQPRRLDCSPRRASRACSRSRDARTGRLDPDTPRPRRAFIDTWPSAPTAAAIASAGQDRTVRLWDVATAAGRSRTCRAARDEVVWPSPSAPTAAARLRLRASGKRTAGKGAPASS